MSTPQAAASSDELVGETRCGYLVREEAGYRTVIDPDLHVLAQTAAPGPFSPVRPEGAETIQCGRTSIVPGPHDDEVIALGMPLFIVEASGSDAGRLGVLEISQGQYRYRLLQGRLTEAEGEAVTRHLNAFQSRSQGDEPASPD